MFMYIYSYIFLLVDIIHHEYLCQVWVLWTLICVSLLKLYNTLMMKDEFSVIWVFKRTVP